MESAAYSLLFASTFFMGFSLPAARSCLALSAVLLIVHLFREGRRPVLPASAWLGLAFLLLTCVVTVFGVNPELGVPKLRKFIWFLGVPVAACLVATPGRLTGILGAYAAGAGVLSARILIMNPRHARAAVEAGRFEDFSTALIDAGSMTDGQRLMLGITISLGFLLVAGITRRGRWGWGLLLLLQAAAMVMNFKRGSWICTLAPVGVLLLFRANWRWLLVAVAALLALSAIPDVRMRVADLSTELREGKGGRMLMWRVIGPELIRRYPGGIGYRSLTNEMMREVDPRVEPNRDHLHSNFLQIILESGWAGLLLWLLWMGRGLSDAGHFLYEAVRRRSPEAQLALILLLLLGALLANGIVEYNMGDAELVIAYGVILGAAAAGRARSPTTAAGMAGVVFS